MSPRFSGRGSKLPPDEEDETVSVQTKAFMSIMVYIPARQKTEGSTILVTETEAVDENTELIRGRDASTGHEVEITVRVKP